MPRLKEGETFVDYAEALANKNEANEIDRLYAMALNTPDLDQKRRILNIYWREIERISPITQDESPRSLMPYQGK